MKDLLVILLVVGVLSALGFLIFRSMRKTTATAAAIREATLEPYLENLREERFEEAYDGFLAEGLRMQISREEFVAAHRARVLKHGKLDRWIHTTISHEANLFETETRLGLRFVLSYETRNIHVLYMSDSGTQPYRIIELLGSEDTSRSLGPGIW